MPSNTAGEYQPASWSELFCQCFPLRTKKPSPADQDIEMQNMSNPVVPEYVVRANNPDNIRRPARPSPQSWWLRDDTPLVAPPPTAGPSGPHQPYTPPQPRRNNLRIAANSPDMFVHDSASSPQFPSLGTPQWDHLNRVQWTANSSNYSSQNSGRIPTPSSIYSEHTSMAPLSATSTIFSDSRYMMSGALPTRPSPSSTYSSAGAVAASSVHPLPSAFVYPESLQVPPSTPRRDFYAGVLAAQEAIDYRRSLQRSGLQPPSPTDVFLVSPPTPQVTPRSVQYAGVLAAQEAIDNRRALQRESSQPLSPIDDEAPPSSPTGSVASIDFFTGAARNADFGVRSARSARVAGAGPYVA
ncbi:hypothetical protein D6D13_05034 [Aureobasidium pullulans]|uniref:Uncharacterized protein n=1 Tax=Aureobasidium pullulans TaxID=5580 RepID=A0A4S9CTZ1_AURPU|nr:hypothetical protein D6D13_05034 [Aureobasidium pullulans]